MISARLDYRPVRPYGYFAVEIATINFYGDSETCRMLDRLSRLIVYDKFDENNSKIEHLTQHKELNHGKLVRSREDIKSFRREHVLWMLSKAGRENMRTLRENVATLEILDDGLQSKITALDDDKFYSAYEESIKYKQLLAELGFTCKSSWCDASNLHKEVYESTCDDSLLMKKVDKMISKLEVNQDIRKQKIDRQYGDFDIIYDEELGII